MSSNEERFNRTMAMDETEVHLHVATLLDRAANMFGSPIPADNRARIFAAIDNPTPETWRAARSSMVNPTITLWQAAIATGLDTYAVPSPSDIIQALEVATR